MEVNPQAVENKARELCLQDKRDPDYTYDIGKRINWDYYTEQATRDLQNKEKRPHYARYERNEDLDLELLWRAGYKVQDIADALGRPFGSVISRAHKLNLPPRKPGPKS